MTGLSSKGPCPAQSTDPIKGHQTLMTECTHTHMAHTTQTQTASRPRDRQPMPPPAHPFIHQQCQSATPLPGPLQDHSPRRPANAGGRLYGPLPLTVNPPLQKPKAQPHTPNHQPPHSKPKPRNSASSHTGNPALALSSPPS